MKKLIVTAVLAFGMNAMHAQIDNQNGNGTGNQTGTGTNTQVKSGSYTGTGTPDITQPHPNVPANVNAQFGTDNPNTSATWRMDGNNYSASWTDRTTNMGRTAVYDKNGKLLHTDNQMGEGSYPTGINDYYMQNYPGESYNVWSSKDAKGNTTYYTTRDGKKISFDKDGNYSTGTKTKAPGSTKTGTKTKAQ